jgi:MFS family permease
VRRTLLSGAGMHTVRRPSIGGQSPTYPAIAGSGNEWVSIQDCASRLIEKFEHGALARYGFAPSMCNPPAMVDNVATPTASRDDRSSLGSAYWWLWTSTALSNLADGVLKVALPLVAISFTRSPTLIAGLTFAFTVPWLLFALLAGAVADRFDRRRLMLGANCLRAALLAAIAIVVLLDAGSIWALYAVALCTGTAETIYDTAAQSIVPQLVRRDQLPRANGRLYAAELTALELAGPPLAGFLVAVGIAVSLETPVGLWVAAVAALLFVHGSFRIRRPLEERTSFRTDIVEGLRFVWRNRLLRTITAMTGVFNFTSSATQAILVLYAVGSTSAIGLTAQAYGWLLSSVAAGALFGSFFAGRVERLLGRARTIGVAFFGGALAIGLPAVTTNPFLIGAAFFVGGAGLIIGNVTTLSLRQRITPGRLLGRVNSSHRLVAYGTKPLGAVAGGVLAQILGLRAVFVIMGLLALAVLAGMTKVTDNVMDAAERTADQS